MAIAFVFHAERLEQSEYDSIMKSLADAGGGTFGGPGLLAHMAGAGPDGGWQVMDIWESEEAANAFYGSEAFGPVREGTADAGLSMKPWPLHRLEVFGAFSQTT